MMNDSPSHHSSTTTTRFSEKSSGGNGSAAGNENGESPTSLVDSALGGSASPDLMQVRMQ